MTKEKSVVEVSKNEVMEIDHSAWGDIVVEAKDLILPRILLMQAISSAVKAKQAQDGDYFNTVTNETFPDSISILPFYCVQSYSVDKWNGKKFEYLKVIPYVTGESRPYEEEVLGVRYKYSHNYEFFCVLEGGGIPAIVSFKLTSHKAGQQLFNLMFIANRHPTVAFPKGKLPCHNWITLGKMVGKNKDGDTFNVSTVATGREATQSEIADCFRWLPQAKEYNPCAFSEQSPSQTNEIPKEVRF